MDDYNMGMSELLGAPRHVDDNEKLRPAVARLSISSTDARVNTGIAGSANEGERMATSKAQDAATSGPDHSELAAVRLRRGMISTFGWLPLTWHALYRDTDSPLLVQCTDIVPREHVHFYLFFLASRDF